jgi:hypothetical protein
MASLFPRQERCTNLLKNLEYKNRDEHYFLCFWTIEEARVVVYPAPYVYMLQYISVWNLEPAWNAPHFGG